MQILHRTRTVTALVPRYVCRFACIGPACEDNCCTSWRVSLDKKSFKAYRESRHPTLAPLFAQHVKRNRQDATDLNYGKMSLRADDAACPMMEQGLCNVQKHLGETHLSHTCFSYPRRSRTFNGELQQALTLSCPEAARQALLQADAFDFVETEVTLRAESVGTLKDTAGLPAELMNEVRIFCLKLMRTQELALWERLAVLGLFCESLSQALAGARHATVPQLLDNFIGLLSQGAFSEVTRDLQPNYASQARVFAALLSTKGQGNWSPLHRQITDRIAANLGAAPDTGIAPGEQLEAAYRRGILRLPQALAAAPFLLEHYLLNDMFLTVFPFETRDPYDSYLRLVSRFGMLRLMLAAQCSTGAELPGLDVLVNTVHVFDRRFQHDRAFAAQTNRVLVNSGWGELKKVYGFLRTE